MKHFYIALFFMVSFVNLSNAQNEFITTWQTTTANERITIPTIGSGYNYTVDWGDGTIETGRTGDASHEYATAGTQTIKISGDFPRIHFNNNADTDKILTVEQWGTIAWESMENAFEGCANLKLNADDVPNLSEINSTINMFKDCTNFEDLKDKIGDWNMVTSTNISNMFEGCTVFNENIGDWDTSGVFFMDATFASATSFNQDISNWDTKNIAFFRNTFNGATAFDQNLGNWNLSGVQFFMTDMLLNSGISQANYDATLIGWARLDADETKIPNNVRFSTNATYCLGKEARDILTGAPNNWTITDGGTTCAATDFFITTWSIASNNEEIALPIVDTGLDFTVDWGDGIITNETEEAYHTYANAGTYTIRISGNFNQIRFNGNADSRKIQTIEQWGSNKWTSMESAFKGCGSLEINATDAPDLSDATSMESMFEDGSCIDNGGNIGNWNVSTISSMNSMFRNAFMNENINTWNVSSVKSIDHMFQACEDFNYPLDQWVTTNLESAIETFADAKSFDQSLGDWDISNVSDFTDIFTNGTGMSDQNYDATLIGWATLESGESLSLNVSFGAGNLKFCLGESARNLLTSSTYNWSITDGGFGCDFTNAFITTWQTTTANESITIPTTGSGYNYAVDWGDGIIESGFTGDATHQYATAGIYTIKINGDFPRINFNNTGDKDKIRSIEQWGTQPWISMANAFRGCTNLKLNADDAPDLTLVTSLYRTFLGCTNLEDLKNNIGTWNLENITTISSLFEDTSFNENINGWNVSKVEDFSSMFKNNTVFNQPLNNWNTEKANDLTNMFDGATAFNQPIGMWNLALAQYFDFMFLNAATFDQNLAAWDISNTSRDSMDGMLTGSAMSQTNYDATLIGWATLETGETRIPTEVKLDASTFYCLGETARNTLTSAPYNWTINDAGKGCPEDFFITTWQTTAANESITIPTTGSGYDYTVDWGDGMVESGFTGDATHQYVTAGIYTVRIIGDFPRISFRFNFENQEKILSVEQWGVQQWTSMEGAFSRCSNLIINATDAPDLSLVTSMRWMFEQTTALVDNGGNMRNWDVSTVEMMTSLFSRSNFNENIDSWNVANVKNFSSMFFRNVRFNQNLNSWNTAMGERFGSMFDGATAFNGTISNWDTGEATSFANMFRDAIAFNQDISGWDTKNLGNINNTFERATAFDQDLGGWDISSLVENTNSIQHMFSNSGMSTENYDATLIGWARLDGGETKIPVGVIFHAEGILYCVGETARNTLTSAPYNWTITDAGKGCPEDFFITTWQTTTANESITIPTKDSGYNYRVDWGDGTIESGFTGDATHQYATAGTYTVKIVGDFPRINFDNTGDKDKIRSIEQWGNIQWTSFREAFYGCENLKLNADDIPDFTQVTELTSMFGECTNFEDLKDTINSWDMSTIEYIHGMFYECSIFNEDISGWVFTNLLRTDSAFEEAFAFNQDISNWNMATVTDMAYMFYNATSFNQPVGNWTLGTVEYMYAMFYGATAFNQDLSNWDFSQVQDIEELFWGASSFDQDLSSWDISSVTNMSEIFTGSGMSQENYDNTLIGWTTVETGETQIPANLTLDADATYCLGEAARNTLTSAPYNWTINDGGLGCIPPVIMLLGDNPQIIEKGTPYIELRVEVTYGATVTITATSVNTNQVGSYTVTYDAVNPVSGISADQVTRTVEVVDTTAPVITLTGANPQIIERGATYTELDATTDDGSTVIIDASTVNMDVAGSYEVTYNATDASGNNAVEAIRTVNVVDTTAPIITLMGDNPQTIELGSGYIELGATIDDGSNVIINTSDFVDAVGSYTIRYNATDASGNVATEVTRTVNVVDTCPLVSLPANNFGITTASETCLDKNNGMINITTATELDYITTIDGIEHNFTSSLEVNNLTPGTYPVCITVAGFNNCEQCFEVVIEAAESLEGKTSLQTDTSTSKMLVEIATGTVPYTVMINNEMVGTYTTKSFIVDVQHGDELEVSSSLACEGKLSTKVNLINEVSLAPNPTRGNVTLSLPDSKLQTIDVSIYNGLGVEVSSKEYTITSGQVMLPMQTLPQGVYFVRLEAGATFKIVKQ